MSNASASIINQPLSKQPLWEQQKAILFAATQKIAPSWPLDQMIAVNPFWQMREQRIEQVAANLGVLGSVHLQMPKQYYLNLYQSGEISQAALQQAAQALASDLSVAQLESFLKQQDESVHWHNIADLLDSQRDPHKMAWRDEIIHQVSQFCAAHYQELEPLLRRGDTSKQIDLYRHWLDVTRCDKGLSIVMDEPSLHQFFAQLPDTHEALLAEAIATFELDNDTLAAYCHALLLDVNGWASWVAYLRWQGDLSQQPNDEMCQLLAIRMAWDLVIWRYLKAQSPLHFAQLNVSWLREKAQLSSMVQAYQQMQRPIWVWVKAAELSYQHQLNQQLQNAIPQPVAAPELQAVFCIDVRSEVMRRALESQHQNIQTFGFAGFFGLPLEYQPSPSELTRPQLPGLLKPVIRVTERSDNKGEKAKLNLRARWQSWSQGAPSAFSMVESTGWLYSLKMLKQSFFAKGEANPVNRLSHQGNWEMSAEGEALSIADKTSLAKGVLHGIGLTSFAPTVLLVGHGSHSANNLHAAGLDCGACGGQTGEVNVRVLAQLLNDQEVRQHLVSQGVVIPEGTRFVAALHNTTTDHIDCFASDLSDSVNNWLKGATTAAQRERAPLLDTSLVNATNEELDRALIKRSQDWSQVRPEWGLANNAAFIVAPRSWTRQVNLHGRAFLHDYQYQQDPGFAVLELILTAPMVVTNWINTQYNASVTDNSKYGSGNKVLHNAVGGHIGVFEGNGGDLRIGLSLQSVHNGEKWMHQPQRLAVYVAAPREPIEQISAKHDNVRHLIDNEWLYLLRWDENGVIERFYQGQWLPQ